MLTVSESTIYGRYGFAPSALVRDLTIDTRRASWTGPAALGRVQFVTREQLLVDGHALVERMRLATPGQIEYGGVLWDRQLGLMVGDEKATSLRFVRYDDVDGVHQGFAIFRLEENEENFSHHELQLLYLVSASDDAYAGLWRFLLEYDLVSKVTAYLRPVDEPLRWMVADYRAIRSSEDDHLWTRILDVKAALEARRFAASGRLVIAVTDPLGFAEGTWAIDADETGLATVSLAPGEQPQATMSANELAALYLGGVSAATLARAGRLTGDAATVDDLFRSAVAPWLSIWF
jgi:predicted acetyltransferase